MKTAANVAIFWASFFLVFGAGAAEPGECRKALQAGTPELAKTHAMEVLRSDTGNREAHLCLARALGTLGDSRGALAALEKAVSLSGTALERATALTLLGNQLMADGNQEAALSAYERSLEIAKAERNIALQRIDLMRAGESHAARADWQTALRYYQEGAALAANDGERADGNAHLASAYRRLGDHDRAIEHGIKAVMMFERGGDPEQYVEASVELGETYRQAGQHENAARTLNKALSLAVQGESAYWEGRVRIALALARLAAGDTQAATEQLRSAAALAERVNDAGLRARLEQAQAALVAR